DVDAGPAPPAPAPPPPPGPDGVPPPTAADPGEATEPSPPPPPPEPLDVFIGGARARDTTGSAHLVSTKQLERFEQDDPHKVLLSVPGVYVRGEDGFGLRPNIGMRGALSDR